MNDLHLFFGAPMEFEAWMVPYFLAIVLSIGILLVSLIADDRSAFEGACRELHPVVMLPIMVLALVGLLFACRSCPS